MDDGERRKIRDMMDLILRSPDAGDGWRHVSRMMMQMVRKFPDQTLIEWREAEHGGLVRLTPKGLTVEPYV